MTNRYPIILALLMAAGATSLDSLAQTTAPVPPIDAIAGDTIYNPEIIYSPIPRSYEIAGISVSGISHVEDYVIIGYSGLSVGERIDIPGDAISNAVKRFWRQGLYSKVQITVDKMLGDKVWLNIALRQQPRMAELRFEGVKGGEKKDLNERLGMVPGQQLTPNIISRVKQIVEKYYAAKGFKNAAVSILQQPDLSKENQEIVTIAVDRHNKVKVHKIYVDGNEVLSDNRVKRAMKKTNENGNLLNLFKQKKFVESDFADDRRRIIEKYNELGFRDAKITHDSVARYDDSHVDVFLTIDEGKKYYISDISWVGNTVYPTETLNNILGIYPGEVYNQKRLDKRVSTDDDAVSTYISTMDIYSSISFPSRRKSKVTPCHCRCASTKGSRPASIRS